MKKAVKIIGVLVVLLVIGVVIAYSSLGSIIKAGVETVGPELTQGDVKLESASLSIFGSGGIKGLEISNPKNGEFASPFAFKMGEVAVSVDVGSISSDKIVVNEILIDGAELCWEGLDGANHKQILANIEAFAGPAAPEGEKSSEETDSGSQKQLEIKKFTMSNTKIHLYGFGKKMAELSLPDFTKEGIGSGDSEEGVKMSDSIGILYESMLGSVGELIKSSKEKLGDSWNKLSEVGSESLEKIKEESKGVVDGIKNLFK